MGNLFIGFPVPRAKIADMISGAAPPLEHHTNHESGGDDEMDVTDLVGAGGVAFPLRGLWIDDFSLDHPRYYTTFTGDGEISRYKDKLTLKTTDTTSSTATLYRIIPQSIPLLTWDKKRHLVFQAYFDCDDKDNTYIWILTGNSGGDNYIGFEAYGGELSAINRNAAGTEHTLLKEFEGAFIGEDLVLEAIHFPAQKVEFWVNGVLQHTETSNVPAGTADANYIFYIYCGNCDSANNVQLDFSHIQFYQEG